MNFKTVRGWHIPDGWVSKVQQGGKTLWNIVRYGYVSLGDSIAAGHTINYEWETDYGEGSQYGKNGNTSTEIVIGSYTDLIHSELAGMYGAKHVSATSFARSGDTVADLMEKLSHEIVVSAIQEADLVTLCIGANDVLQPAMMQLEEYINTGDLSTLTAAVDANLTVLADDTAETSYMALFKRLTDINPKAQYVFTTVYNPYKYLWMDEGNDGFFAPLLNTIPDITLLGFDIDNIIKDQFFKMDVIALLCDRINGLGDWAETNVTKLNKILSNKIAEYGADNFKLADTKTLYEVFPDRPVSASKHYNDLVSVEYTRGYDTAQMDWGRLWEGSNAVAFWTNLATKHISLSGLDITGLTSDLVSLMIDKVIVPDVDPHPEEHGHYVLKRSFVDALGWTVVDRHTITFVANGGSGTMESQAVVGVDGLPAFTILNDQTFTPATGYYFTGWNTSPDGTGTTYSNGQLIGVASDITLYAQWSNIYQITYKHTNKTVIYTDDETGHMECYALWIDGEEQADFGKFSEGSQRTIYRPYGSRIGVVVSNYNPNEIFYDDCNCDVYFNGVNVASGYRGTAYEFTLTGNVTVDFQWKIAGSLATFDAQSWEDCYITTV